MFGITVYGTFYSERFIYFHTRPPTITFTTFRPGTSDCKISFWAKLGAKPKDCWHEEIAVNMIHEKGLWAADHGSTVFCKKRNSSCPRFARPVLHLKVLSTSDLCSSRIPMPMPCPVAPTCTHCHMRCRCKFRNAIDIISFDMLYFETVKECGVLCRAARSDQDPNQTK